MAEVVSPILWQNVLHTQAVATAIEIEEVQFQLSSDEAARILMLEVEDQEIFAQAVEAVTAWVFSVDPNPTYPAITTGQPLPTEIVDSDVIWFPMIVKDLVTSGAWQVRNYFSKDLRPISGDIGLILAQNMSVGFSSVNVGNESNCRITYEIVRLTDRELVSLVARRRG